MSFSNITLDECPYDYLFALGTDAKPLIDAIIQKDSGLITNRRALKEPSLMGIISGILSVAQWNATFANSIVHINLTESDVYDIPKEIKYLPKLKTLTLTNSMVRTLSDEIGELTELAHILGKDQCGEPTR